MIWDMRSPIRSYPHFKALRGVLMTQARYSRRNYPRLRPAVQIVASAHGAVAPAILLGLGAAAEDDLAQRPSCHDGEDGHDHDDFDSFCVTRGPVEDPAGFAVRLETAMAAHDILRIKGFLDVGGKPFRSVVQGVGGRVGHYFDRPWRADEPRASRLVVIGRKGIDRVAIAADLMG